MNIEAERERFHDWLANVMGDTGPLMDKRGHYIESETRLAWVAWKACLTHEEPRTPKEQTK